MTVLICHCIHNDANPGQVLVYSPTCTVHDPATRHETAAMTASAQHPTLADRALTIAARIALLLILAWIFTTDDHDLAWVHVIFGLAAIPLARLAMPIKEHP